MKKLTVGMATHNDFDGVYFTIQSLRLANRDLEDQIEYLVVDNNPDSPHGKTTEHFCKAAGVRYVPEAGWKSTAVRNRVFENAETPFVLCLDSHVLLGGSALGLLLQHFENDPHTDNLFHGIMLYDPLNKEAGCVTHMNPEWRSGMYGTWGHEPENKIPYQPIHGEAFNIPMHGMGLFACRREAWVGFNPLFRGFGGEEGYIHEKFRQAGGVTMCLPWLKWVHRFDRPNPVAYPLAPEQKVLNYYIGWGELGMDTTQITDHFKGENPELDLAALEVESMAWLNKYEADPEKTLHERHNPTEEPRVWNTTATMIKNPLELEFNGNRFQLAGFQLKWSAD